MEREGKISLMGIPDPFVHIDGPLPASIDGLQLVIWATSPSDNPFRRFVLKLTGAISSGEPVEFDLTEEFKSTDVQDSSDGRLTVTLSIDLPPLTVGSSASIDVIVETERETLRVARFPIRLRDATP